MQFCGECLGEGALEWWQWAAPAVVGAGNGDDAGDQRVAEGLR